ncbi:MAG: lipoyl synthase [Porphyromonadaceae bacterium]|nr:MAG: lipoyl synthase [Porphyromonadaceae bacterium]
MEEPKKGRLPDWLKLKSRLDQDETHQNVRRIVKENNLNTICISGNCPNIGECWRAGTATFMILGNICTRACKFCGVATGKPLLPDPGEPARIADSIKKMGVKHAVITSVDRDDLPDRGAGFWAQTIRTIREVNPTVTMETLIPDFDGKPELINLVIDAAPDVISHNLETVRRLTPDIRTKARYDTSLSVIRQIADSGIVSKSGIMLGLGETPEEVVETMDDLLKAGCQVMTIGQYLQPTRDHLAVNEWVTPEQYQKYEDIGLKKGFRFVESHPLVRSSYHAEKHITSKNDTKDHL